MFFEIKFTGQFDAIALVLGDALLASYLLALDQVSGEIQSGEFAEGDDELFNFDLPPEEAIKYFRDKRVVTSKKFNDLREEARSAAFTVGGIYEQEVLEGFKEEIARSLEEGIPQRETIKRFREILDGAGHKQLGAFHLETIFRTNMQMAYGVGRRQALEGVADDLSLWEYHAVLDDRTRPTHAALDGLILPATHEFWNDHYPPWGFNCRCTVTARPTMPDSYDHSNPSGSAEIAYDKKGNPAKAEVGTSVVDLNVGKFKGVPPQGGLKSTIEDAVGRAKASRKK
jgi:SPP1 gp7 family putative phage head morphogenesis protein